MANKPVLPCGKGRASCRVTCSLIFCVLFCRLLIVICPLAIALSDLRYIDSDYSFGIFKLFFQDIDMDLTVFFRKCDHIRVVMVNVLASSAVYRVFEPWSGKIKNYNIGICCFSAKHAHAALRRHRKDLLSWNQTNVSEWSDMSTRGLQFQ